MANMLKMKVTNEIEFGYYDSGAPANKADYDTIVLIHGHTYHSGTFMSMLYQASSFGYRLILPNRRLYPGSTPYTKEETASFQADRSVEELTRAFLQQGQYLLLFVHNVIKEHNLKRVMLLGWSLGTGFLSATIANITAVSEDIQTLLRSVVKTIVWWDPPATAHGIVDPPTGGWIPLYDESLTPEQRGQAFGVWLAQYYPHKDLAKKDCHTLIYKMETPVKTPSFSSLSFEEFLAMVDLTAGLNGDNAIPDAYFQPVVKATRELAFLSKGTRDGWGNVPFGVIYGEESPYNVQWAVWMLEEEAETTGLPLKIKSMPGANHFAMADHTELVFNTLKEYS